jgi:hypothetical protein
MRVVILNIWSFMVGAVPLAFLSLITIDLVLDSPISFGIKKQRKSSLYGVEASRTKIKASEFPLKKQC